MHVIPGLTTSAVDRGDFDFGPLSLTSGNCMSMWMHHLIN